MHLYRGQAKSPDQSHELGDPDGGGGGPKVPGITHKRVRTFIVEKSKCFNLKQEVRKGSMKKPKRGRKFRVSGIVSFLEGLVSGRFVFRGFGF